MVGYLGHLDVLVIWPFAKVRGIPVCWDVFISIYDTVVRDRRLVSPYNPVAWLIFCWEWLACRCCEMLLMDTSAHAEMLRELYGLTSKSVNAVLVGAEPETFPVVPDVGDRRSAGELLRVLFYGQFIPLHGIETIIEAAKLLEAEAIEWMIIGQGQEQDEIKGMLAEHPLQKLKWISWIDYEKLSSCIAEADICLGIFGTSEKSARVIPNKAFQIISTGKPLVTRDSPAIRELVPESIPGVYLVDAGNAVQLAKKIVELAGKPSEDIIDLHATCEIRQKINPRSIGRSLIAILSLLPFKGSRSNN
jgi:glycosyltransferase involved in cell wall biosynthesis